MTSQTLLAVAIAAFVMTAGVGYYFIMEKNPVITLISDGENVGTMSVFKGDVADTWIRETGESLTNGDLYFAGWYSSSSYDTAFYEFLPINSSITLYAKWSVLDFSVANVNVTDNQEACTFECTSDFDSIVSWTVKDSFKTNNTPSNVAGPGLLYRFTGGTTVDGSVPGSGSGYLINLPPGRYDVTLDAVVDGSSAVLTKTVTVDGTVTSGSLSWNDYNDVSATHSFTYSFDVKEYILYAEMNRAHYFRIPNIASFAIVSETITQIADGLMAKAVPLWTERYDQMNFIASFVNNTSKIGPGSPVKDGYYYGPPATDMGDTYEYYKYPMESLYDQILYGGYGDCEDHAILTAAVAKAAGFDSAIIVITNPNNNVGHATAGIKDGSFDRDMVKVQSGAYFRTVDGYYACETFRSTGKYWVGNMENAYREMYGYILRAFAVR